MLTPLLRMRMLTSTLALLAAGPAAAMTIDFESIPGGGSASELTPIREQYRSTFGVRFGMEGGGVPVLAQIGGTMTAFGGGIDNVPDMPLGDQGVGSFFLTDDGSVAAPPRPLWIGYDTAVSAASGAILDVDYWGKSTTIYESFTIDAWDAQGQLLESIEIRAGDLGTGDGIASIWSIERDVAEIRLIRVSYTGTKDFGVGLAFDNFSPSSPASTGGPSVPEPGAAAIFATALALVARRRSARS
jgi:hypothetical protein